MRPSVLLVLTAALTLPACTQEAAEPNETRSQAAQSAPNADFDPQKERALKERGQASAVKKRVASIDWADAQEHPQAELASLSAEQRARLADAPVPALVPNRPQLLGAATVTSGEHWYAASLDGHGHSVYVSGTRLETVVPNLKVVDDQPDIRDDFRITRNELIVSLSFNAFGAAYVIEVECAQPSTDTRCTDDGYVVALANELVLPKRGER